MRRLMVLLPLLLTLACATSGTRPAPASRDTISAEEIAAANVNSALEAIQRLRPQFLRVRAPRSMQNPSPTPEVYLDHVHVGGVDMLRRIPANTIAWIRYIDARDATTRWGTGHTGGVIEVLTKT